MAIQTRTVEYTHEGETLEAFMAWDDAHGYVQGTIELLVVAAANTARFQLQNRRVVVDFGDGDVPRFQSTHIRLHYGERSFRQRHTDLLNCSS